MTETTVTGDQPEREKPVAELDRDDWVEVIDEEGETLGEARVLHVEPYNHSLLGRRVKLMFSRTGYDPEVLDLGAEMTVPMLTDEQVAAEMESERREGIATRFDKLAELFRHTGTPLPEVWRGITVDVDFGPDFGKVDAIAGELGLKVSDPGSGSMVGAFWEEDTAGNAAGVTVHFHGYRPKSTPPANPTGEEHVPAEDATIQPRRAE